jgi:hypothetical protein
VFVAWELLRLAYNAALLMVVVLVGRMIVSRDDFADPAFWRYVAKCAIGANLCYCLGPIAEGYLAALGVRRPVVRLLLFSVGLIVSVVLAVALLSLRDLAGF